MKKKLLVLLLTLSMAVTLMTITKVTIVLL